MEPTTSVTNTRHADQAKKWGLLALKLVVAGALIGAIVGAPIGFYDQRGKHDPVYTWERTALPTHRVSDADLTPEGDVRAFNPKTGEEYDVTEGPGMEVVATIRDKGYVFASDPVPLTAPDGTLGEVPAKNLAAALRAGFKSKGWPVPVEVQRKLDREHDLDEARSSALVYALGLGILGLLCGLIPAAWFLFLVMLGQIAAALRSRD